MTRMKPGPIAQGFRQHAAPSAIRHHLAEAKRDHAAYGRLVADLDALLTQRNAEVEAGAWPPPPSAEALALRARFADAAGSGVTA